MPAGAFAEYASPERCNSDLCRRLTQHEPLLPIAPPFDEGLVNPCLRPSGKGKAECIPAVHVLGGWHSFVEEGLQPLMAAHDKLKMHDKLGATCFNDWGEDPAGPERWFGGWGVRPEADRMLVQQCVHLLSFYPAYPNGYLNAFLKAYWPCKTEEVAKLKAGGKEEGDYYGGAMWATCRPRALAAHDQAIGTGGIGHELTPPFVMRTVYGDGGKHTPRLVALLRSPTDRIETSFWAHPHYPLRYGADADGFERYVDEQTKGFAACEARHGVRRCAFLFEMLAKEHADVFFHADQVIRGIYEPFVAEWRAAFPSSLLVLRAEDLYDDKAASRAKLRAFLGIEIEHEIEIEIEPPASQSRSRSRSGDADAAAGLPSLSYAQQHAASLAKPDNAHKAAPMHAHTRQKLAAFYRPHNQRLAALLQDPKFAWE